MLVAFSAIALAACGPSSAAVPSAARSTAPPVAECSPALTASIGCDVYRSVTATEGENVLSWVEGGAIEMEAALLDDAPTLVLATPCNVLNLAIELDDSTFIPGDVISTTTGCEAERAYQEQWVKDFFDTEVQWEKADSTLTLSADGAVLVFATD